MLSLVAAAPWREELPHFLLHPGRTVIGRETGARVTRRHRLPLPYAGARSL